MSFVLIFHRLFSCSSVSTEAILACSMGVSGKWIKALVGLKKSEKSPSSEKDENVGIIIFSSFSNIHQLSFQSFFRKVEYMVVIFGILVNDEVLILFASCYSFAPYISSKTISTYVVFNPMD